jgi:hypothetical protein
VLFSLGSQEGPWGCYWDWFFGWFIGQLVGFKGFFNLIVSVQGGRNQTCLDEQFDLRKIWDRKLTWQWIYPGNTSVLYRTFQNFHSGTNNQGGGNSQNLRTTWYDRARISLSLLSKNLVGSQIFVHPSCELPTPR